MALNANNIRIEQLWGQLHNRLCRFICSRMPDEADAEDILQDVFLRIHTNLDKIRDMDRLESWIYQVARNSVNDFYRKRHKMVELSDLATEAEGTGEDIAADLAPYLRQVVDSLPEPYRQALILTEYQGVRQKDLAIRMGISFTGARSRVQRARQKVKETLLQCCHFEFDVRGVVCCYRDNCCCCESEP